MIRRKRRKSKPEDLAIGTIKTGLVVGAGTVVAPSAGANLAMVGSFTPAVISFGMGTHMIRGFRKIRKKVKGGIK